MSKKGKQKEKAKLPVATVAYYGPDDKTPTKVAVGIIKRWGREPVELKRWWGKDVVRDLIIQKEVAEFIKAHEARSVVVTEGIIGCPHEEGIDFPVGGDCPYCPFWQGKQRGDEVHVSHQGVNRPVSPKLEKSAVVIAVATYTREQWGKLMEVAADRDKLERSWQEWKVAKDEALAHIREQGFEPIEIPVDVDALQEFCRQRGLRNDSGARAEYVVHQQHQPMEDTNNQ